MLAAVPGGHGVDNSGGFRHPHVHPFDLERERERAGESLPFRDVSPCFRAPLNIPDTPPRLPRRPPQKGNKRETLQDIARRVPVEVIRPYFNYPLRAAADALSISVTTLKRLCRRHGVKRWPHRQLSGLNRAVGHLEAKQQLSADPVIADQLRQLYSRRDVVIDLAFVSDEDAPEPKLGASAMAPNNSTTLNGTESMSMRPALIQSLTGQQGINHTGSTQDAMIPWWHRDPGASPWQRGGSGGGDTGGSGAGASVSAGVGSGYGIGDDGRGCEGGPTRSSGEGGCATPRAGDGSDFRASSVLVRLPGMSPPPPPAGCSSAPPTPSRQAMEHSAVRGMPAGIPSASSACGGRDGVQGGGAAQRQTLSPMTIAYSVNPPAASESGGVARIPAAQYYPLPSNYPSESIDRQITELSALNEILLGPEGEDPHGFAAASDRGGGALQRPKAVTLAALGSSGTRACAVQRGVAVNGGDLVRCNDGNNGRLPSIAGLVAAGAMLNDDKWRSCRPPSSFRVREHVGQV